MGGKQHRRRSDFSVYLADCIADEVIPINRGALVSQTPHIHIIDDDEALRVALARLLTATGYNVKTYPSAVEFLLRAADDGPGCILLDYRLPGPNGLELQEVLHRRMNSMPVIFLSGAADISKAVLAMKAGAVDFLSKPVKQEELLAVVKNALMLQAETCGRHELISTWREMYATLSPRELEVFDGIVAGRLNKQIAADIFASERTVKAHRASIMAKMCVNSLAELVQIAVHLNLCETQKNLRIPSEFSS